MAIPILASVQVGRNNSREITAKEFTVLLRQLNRIPQIGGIELRFGGDVDNKGRIIDNSIDDVMKVCDSVEKDFGSKPVFLHLSKLGLNLCAGNFNSEELRGVRRAYSNSKLSRIDFSEDFMRRFNLAIGHCKEHDYAFGKIVSHIYAVGERQALARDGHQKSAAKQRALRQAEDLSLLPSDLERILVVENGYMPFNCLPQVVQLAQQESRSICLDTGHLVRGLLGAYVPQEVYKEIKSTALRPLVLQSLHHADNMDIYYNKYRNEYMTLRLNQWGNNIRHVHFHGAVRQEDPKMIYAGDKPIFKYTDHAPLNSKTLPQGSRQINILQRLITGGKGSIKSATLELEKSHLIENPGESNPENLRLNTHNIVKSILYFTDCFAL